MPGHATGDAAAFKCRSRRTRGCDQPVSIAHDDFGIGAHIDEHKYVVLITHFYGEHIRCDIAAHMACNKGHAIYPRFGICANAQPPAAFVKGGCFSLSGQIFVFYLRFIGFLADALHIEPEKHIPHGGIAGYDNFVNFLSLKTQFFTQYENFVVDRIYQCFPQLIWIFAIIGNAIHDIAAAKALGIFIRRIRNTLARFQIYEVHHDCRGAHINCQSVDVSPKAVNVFPVVEYPVCAARDQRIEINFFFLAQGQNLRRAAQGRKFDFCI